VRVPGHRPRLGEGLEIDPYTAELAWVLVRIGEMRRMRRNGFGVSKNRF
jgi:hypothetical protein